MHTQKKELWFCSTLTALLFQLYLLPSPTTAIQVYEDVNDNFTTIKPTLYHHQSYPTKSFTTQSMSMIDDMTTTTQPMSTQPMSTEEPTTSASPTTTNIPFQERSKASILDEMRKNNAMQYPKVYNKNIDGKQQSQQEQNFKAQPNKSNMMDTKKGGVQAFSSSADRINYKNRQLYAVSNILKVEPTATAADSSIAKSVKNPKQFFASPQLAEYQEPKPKGVDHFFPTDNYYKPMKQDAQFPDYAPTGDIWSGMSHSPFSSDQKQEQKPQINHKHQHMHHFPTAGKDDAAYNWYVQNEQQSRNVVREPQSSSSPVSSRGKWHWIPEGEAEEEDTKVESKIMTQIPSALPTIYEEVRIIQDYKPSPVTVLRDHPYTYDMGSGYQGYAPASFASNGGGVDGSTKLTSEIPFSFDYKTQEPFHRPSVTAKQRPVSPWKKIIHVLTAAIPLGLIISALTPHVVYVDPNSTQPILSQAPPVTFLPAASFQPHRQRSVLNSAHNSILSMLSNNAFTHIDRTPACEDRIFCEMARMGEKSNAEQLYKMLWKIANETPDDQAHHAGLHDVFKAVKNNNCAAFKCENINTIFETAQKR